jgi:hypothetical protein
MTFEMHLSPTRRESSTIDYGVVVIMLQDAIFVERESSYS